MRLVFPKSKWEAPLLPIEVFLEAVREAGFDATEIHVAGCRESPERIREAHAAAGLPLIAQIVTAGRTPAEHAASLETLYRSALEAGPVFVNAHTGRDVFPFEDNLALFARALELQARHGVPLVHETHRGRALFTAPGTAAFLRALPDLRITADFSHWFCVHESDLADQEDDLRAAIAAAVHIHARVGFDEGPQVSDPRNPAHERWLARHVELWRRILRTRREAGCPQSTITPEFGPVPYMPLAGAEDRSVGDAWEINRWMKDHLRPLLAGA
jgi:sugar phosphate isomerase/epimerase